MKNVSLFRKMGYVLSLILCCVIISCTVEHSDDSSKISIKESDISSKWLRQVKYAINLGDKVSSEEQLTLVGYEYLGTINTELQKQQVLDEILSIGASTVVLNNEYRLVGFSTRNQDAPAQFREFLSDKVKVGKSEVVQLTWRYKDEVRTSKALVDSEEGIIYDNIGNYAIDYSASQNLKMNVKTRVINRGTRSADSTIYDSVIYDSLDSVIGPSYENEVPTVITEGVQDPNSVFGDYLWRVEIQIYSYFDNQTGVFTRAFMPQPIHTETGSWMCEAQSITVEGRPGLSTEHVVAWAWVSRDMNNPYHEPYDIVFNGRYYVVSGGGPSQRDVIIHTKDGVK